MEGAGDGQCKLGVEWQAMGVGEGEVVGMGGVVAVKTGICVAIYWASRSR